MNLFIKLLLIFSSFTLSTSSFVNFDKEPHFQDLIREQNYDYDTMKIIEKQNLYTDKLRSNNKTVCNVLEFAGIGPFAGVSVGLGSRIAQQGLLNKSYDIVTGSSGSAINALIAGKFQDISKALYIMRGFWSSLQNKYVYYNDSSNFLEEWGSLNNSPLKQTIKNLDKATGTIYFRDVEVDVTNLNYNEGILYKLNDEKNINRVEEIVSASMNFPFYFQKMMLDGDYITDGSLFGFTSFSDIIGLRDCDYFVFDVIGYILNYNHHTINSFEEYIKNVFYTLTDMPVELNNIVGDNCDHPKGIINVYSSHSNVHHEQNKNIIEYSNVTNWISDGIKNDYSFKSVPFC